MGQTLSNGVYLPNEGERNCYAGLASNWQILNTAVGAIAEKAPLVHTHTVSQITDFPALATVATSGSYNDLNNIPTSFTPSIHTHGNITNDGKIGTTANLPLITGTGGAVQAGSFGTSANTFCEGNDSRLSDARTPLSHTHTKSDVTDLFNSANTWTESQTYSKTTISNAAEVLHCKNANVALGETPTSDYQKLFMFKDKNNDNFGYYRHLYQTTGSSQFDILVRNKFTNGAPDTSGSIDYLSFSLRLNADKSKEGVLMGSFKPSNTNTYDLGSSSYQWNNLYAKSYYYNGVAWGLDKSNTWSANNSFYGITVYGNATNTFQSNSSVGEKGDGSIFALNIQVQDKNHASWASSGVANIGLGQDNNGSYLSLALETIDSNNTRRTNALSFLLKPTDNSHNAYFFPNRDNTIDLGTSNNRWKTLNGINPGALSFPNTDFSKIVDFSTTLNDITKVAATASKFSWTATVTGWMTIVWYVRNLTPPHRVAVYTTLANHDGDGRYHTFGTSFATSVADYFLFSSFPAVEGVKYWFETSFSNTTDGIIYHAYLLPCLGNV